MNLRTIKRGNREGEQGHRGCRDSRFSKLGHPYPGTIPSRKIESQMSCLAVGWEYFVIWGATLGALDDVTYGHYKDGMEGIRDATSSSWLCVNPMFGLEVSGHCTQYHHNILPSSP